MDKEKLKQKLNEFLAKKIVRFFYSKTFFMHASIMLVLFVVLSFAVVKSLDAYTDHDQKIAVPNLSKKSVSEAKTMLKKLNLRFKVIDSSIYKPNYPKKSVIGQNPLAGNFVKEDRMIYLNINAWGYQNVEVPRFYGKTKRKAISELIARGFVINPDEEFVPDIATNIVRGLKFKGNNINAGDKLPKTSELTLVLGDGKGLTRYVEPSTEGDE